MATTEKLVTPVGDLEWVTVTGEGKENLSGKLQYVANLVLDGADAEKLKAKIEKFWEDNKPSTFKKPAKSFGFYPHKIKTDKKDDNGLPIYEETGKTTFAFKTGTTFADGSTKVVDIYNAKAVKISLGEQTIGNGSQGAISGAMGIYVNKAKSGALVDAGTTLYLNAIQLTKFVPYSQDAGFAAQEGDFDGSDEATGFEQHEEAPAQPRL